MENFLQRNDYKHAYVCVDLSDRYDQSIHCFDDDENVEVVRESNQGSSKGNDQQNHSSLNNQSYCCFVDDKRVADVDRKKYLGSSKSNCQLSEFYFDEQSRDYLVFEEKVAHVLESDRDRSRNSDELNHFVVNNHCVQDKCLGPSGNNGQLFEIYLKDKSRDCLVSEKKVGHVLNNDQDSSRNSDSSVNHCVSYKCRSPSGSNGQLNDFLNNHSKNCLSNDKNVTYVLDSGTDRSRNIDQLNCSTGNVQCDRENNIRGLRCRYQMNRYNPIDDLCQNSVSRDLKSSDQLNFPFSNDLCDGKRYQFTSKDNGQS